ncbi:MAG TPA: hypothetical protein VMF90_18870 [Rhizobiaceae bacterium]|nr:hypothetical protein [Rhizobiaceae bacterium]
MRRKKTGNPSEKRSPEVDAALRKLVRTSLKAACICLHEVPGDNGEVSPRAILLSDVMTWFLGRIHPDDLRDLYFGRNGVATWGFKPFPDEIEFEWPSFTDAWKMFENLPAVSPFAEPDRN